LGGIVGNIVGTTLDVNATIGDLSLLVEIARGEGVIETIDAVSNAVTIQATPGVATLYLGTIDDTLVLDRNYDIDPATDLDYTTIGALGITIDFSELLEILGLTDITVANVAINARAYAEGQGNESTFTFTGP